MMIDRGEEQLWQREQCANSRGMLNATKVKAVFARLVREAIRAQGFERYCLHLCKLKLCNSFVTMLLQKIPIGGLQPFPRDSTDKDPGGQDDKNNKANKNSFVNGHPTWGAGLAQL